MKIDFFTPIQLDQMDKVTLMNRTDTKYWFHTDRLQDILHELKDNYFLLHIGGEGLLPYETTYFDTFNNEMFASHHNGKLNRYKIRRRTYLSSDKSYMEIKFKSNKGRTIKERISTSDFKHDFTSEETSFLKDKSPYQSQELRPVLLNRFHRMMLVSRKFDERCTIDIGLQFESDSKQVSLDNLVIVEVKTEGQSKTSPLMHVLQRYRIKTSGFSKYCVGRVVTDNKIKRNRFKSKIREIEKVIATDDCLFH